MVSERLRVVVHRRLPEAVIVLGAVYCAGVAGHGLAKAGVAGALSGPNTIALGSSVAMAVVLVLALLLPRPARARLALALGSLCAAIFPAELYLTVAVPSIPKERAARAAGQPFDHRSRPEVVRDLRSRGVDAVVFFRNVSSDALTHTGPDGRVLPVLGGVSLATTVYCNESGQYAIYAADEHGFNNPRGSHERVPLQVALIGDSFTHGACVPREASIAGHVRDAFPRTLNLGATDSGPLSQLARFVEYAAPLRPRFVVWNWFEGNDLDDLYKELLQAPLRRYLAAPVPLGLKARQAEIDHVARTAIDARLRWLEDNQKERRMSEDVKGRLLLRSIRNRLATAALVMQSGAAPNVSEDGPRFHEELAVVERILAAAQNAVGSWGGDLVMVFLADSPRYCGAVPTWLWRRYCVSEWVQTEGIPRSNYRDDVLAIFTRLGLPVVDGHAAFADTGRPADMFYYPGSHYSPAGYRVIADALLRKLRTRLAASETNSSAP